VRRALALTGIATVACLALWFAGRALIRLPWCEVEAVEAIGASYYSAQDIVDSARVQMGAPLYAVDADSVMNRVRAMPWISDVSIERRLSGTFEIHVTERRAVGVVTGRIFSMVDASGVEVPVEDGLVPDLPLLTGLADEGSDRALALVRLGRVLARIARLEPLGGVVSEVSVADPTLMVVVLSPAGMPVWLPPNPGLDRLVMLASLVAHHPDVLRTAKYIDARFAGHLAVNS